MNRNKSTELHLAEAVECLSNYRDPVAQMTRVERERYNGKLLAVLCETGEVIAAERSEADLEAAIRESRFAGRRWRVMGGPTDAPAITVEEFLRLNGEAS